MMMRARSCVASAAQKGHVEMLQYLCTTGLSVVHVWPSVCAGGHLDMAQYLWTQELGTWDDANINGATERGHFELLRFLLDVGYTGFDRRTLALAIQYDQLEFVQCLVTYALGPASVSLPSALCDAVEYSRLDLLSRLCAQLGAQDHLAATEATALYYCAPTAIVQCIQNARYRNAVAQRTRSVLLSKVHFQAISMYQDGVDTSTRQVRELCKDLALVCNYENEVPLPRTYATYHERFCHWLSRHDLSQLDLLCWPHLVAYALSYGNMAVLEVLQPRVFAAQRRVEFDCHGRCMCYSAKNNLYCHKVAFNCVTIYAAVSGYAELLAFLYKHDCGVAWVWYCVSLFGHLSIAKFAHGHRFAGWKPRFMCNAALAGHLNLIMFFHEHDYAGFGPHAISAAVHSGNVDLTFTR
ncbi:hypothetical protein SDRG_05248 [Saprolegnia diclina VS20]|uniref:Uncharacterized protein n=1 Tax=Saprolegnia diclina (strain VS20) TaxID=1156394 RepID=T0QUG6_SAPDV|nr:hypothetical protein SDRG_05248 [Saprolegnia diclina VS20]EQC37660.1 hypothetical protein SDRG_05248 [Saprolegnia diclina VS20]|eukprot:XP_008609180.1 hypothetical protein SDRG_05248 [Saprolegnia diclina VS20]